MSFLAAAILLACSPKRAAVIQPRTCFEFDLTRESKSIEALLTPPISASDLMATLSGSKVPPGSTDVAVPELGADAWSSLSVRIFVTGLSLVKVPEFAGVSDPFVAYRA